jgi:hypothetical protein
MGEHTPGPWDWIAIGANASGGHHLYIVDAARRKIAALWGKADEKVANAELVSRAPEMLSLLQRAFTAARLPPKLEQDISEMLLALHQDDAAT